jgi:hypothetical protein
MKTLADILLAAPQRDAVVEETVRLIESHVGSRPGLRGMSLKTGLAMVKAAKPGILVRAVQRLLPEFVQALEPLYREFRDTGSSDFSGYLNKHGGRATAALLHVADARIEQASPMVRSAYAKFRGSAEAEIAAALPRLARMISARLR